MEEGSYRNSSETILQKGSQGFSHQGHFDVFWLFLIETKNVGKDIVVFIKSTVAVDLFLMCVFKIMVHTLSINSIC